MKSLEIDREIRIMEICGTHTTTILKSGIKKLLPENVRLVTGPGCPVCVTSQGYIDAAIKLSEREDVIITTFGDMINVPGTNTLEETVDFFKTDHSSQNSDEKIVENENNYGKNNIVDSIDNTGKTKGELKTVGKFKKDTFLTMDNLISKNIDLERNVNSLMNQRSKGKDIRVIYSPLEAINIAKKNPDKEVVFLAIGFETTASTIALAVQMAYEENIRNFSIFSSIKTMPEAINTLLADKETKVDGIICPGHVSTIIGEKEFRFVSDKLKIPSVIAGFEDRDVLIAICLLIDMIKENRHELKNIYECAVKVEGNKIAKDLMDKIYKVTASTWRGLGVIENSGLALSDEYKSFDAELKFNIKMEENASVKGCICGSILKGQKIPTDCKLFGKKCTPYSPIGVCMVSKEGTCGIHYKYLNEL